MRAPRVVSAPVARLRHHPWVAGFVAVSLALLALHLVALDASPPGLYADEASIGYNAWAVAHYGVDEHGARLPLFFEAFGEYKNPLYIYALAPLTRVLPLTPYVVRLPAALFGLVVCAMLALFAYTVTRSRGAALLTLVIAGVTPWLVQESRLGFEVISMVALLAVMLWCLARAVASDSWPWFAGAGVALGLSTFAYSTGRAFTMALLVALVVCFGIRARSRAWLAVLPGPLAALATLFTYNALHGGAVLARFNTISIGHDSPGWLSLLLRFLNNYTDYWDFRFLFTHGDGNIRHSTGFGGMLLVSTLPVLLAGFAVCLTRLREALPRFLLLGALLAPIPAALTDQGTPHSLRAATMLPFVLAFAAYGSEALLRALRGRRVVAAVLAGAVLVEAGGYFLDMYRAYPNRALLAFDTGQTAAIQRAVSMAHGHDVYVSRSLEAGYIDTLFALRPPPPPEQTNGRAMLTSLHVHVADADTISMAAGPGDMLVLSATDALPGHSDIVYTDERDSGPGNSIVVLVLVARLGA
jgi:hypothetical protein